MSVDPQTIIDSLCAELDAAEEQNREHQRLIDDLTSKFHRDTAIMEDVLIKMDADKAEKKLLYAGLKAIKTSVERDSDPEMVLDIIKVTALTILTMQQR